MAKKGRKSQRTGVRGQGPGGGSAWSEFYAARKRRERLDRVRRRKQQRELALGGPSSGQNRGRSDIRDRLEQYQELRSYDERARALGKLIVKATLKGKARRVPDLVRVAGRRRRAANLTPEQLCADYRKDVKERRQAMFAAGSAGRGRRNTGKRSPPDWRSEFCS